MTTTAPLPPKVDLAKALAHLAQGETLDVIGRCGESGYRHRVRLSVNRLTEVPAGQGNGYVSERHPETATMTDWIGTAFWLREMAGEQFPCPTHGSWLKFQGLRAITSHLHQCGQACEEAVSAECRCSCGGTNHGIR